MNRLTALAPLGLVFAWSAPWVCQPTGKLADGGLIYTNDSGLYAPDSGGQYKIDAGGQVTYQADSGIIGVQAGTDGGVTIGPSAAFSSDFVYMSNSLDGTISRIIIPSSGSAPYEEARYPSVLPLNNHGKEPCTGVGGACSRTGNHTSNDIWEAAGSNQYNGAGNSPSRTLIDRNGNVWVALRAPGRQAGATKIINVDDHLAQCQPRCQSRKGLALVNGKPQSFTEGVPLLTTSGSYVTLTPPGVINANSSYAKAYACQDVGHDTTGVEETDPVNYDDCLAFSIPLGDPHPDPWADPAKSTKGTSFGRAAAISPNCDPATGDCDVWLGMWNGASWVRMSYNGTGTLGSAPFDVGATIGIGVNPYGASIDCAGILWGVGLDSSNAVALSALTTVAVNDTAHGIKFPAYQLLSDFSNAFTDHAGRQGVPRLTPGSYYGISSDSKERIWTASGGGGAKAHSFDAAALLSLRATLNSSKVPYATFTTAVQSANKTYDFTSVKAPPSYVTYASTGTYSRGINIDVANNVYVGMDLHPWNGSGLPGTGAVSFNPDKVGTVPCTVGTSAVTCPSALLNWDYNDGLSASGPGGTVGIDLDAEGNAWVGNYGGAAIRFQGPSGASPGTLMSKVAVGNGVYSYSDFTGYSLRYITLNRAVYPQTVSGCQTSVAPELTDWTSMSYSAAVPIGTDIQFDVRVSNSTDPAIVAQSQDFTVCDSLSSPASPTSCPKNADGSINLGAFGLPQGRYLTIYTTMTPLICGANGGSGALSKPTLFSLATTQTCPGN